jgi:hypothetical protein
VCRVVFVIIVYIQLYLLLLFWTLRDALFVSMDDSFDSPKRQLFRTRSMSISQNAPEESQYTSKHIDGFKVKFQGTLYENVELVAALTEDLTLIRAKYLHDQILTKLKTNDVKIWVHEERNEGEGECELGCCHFFRCGKDVVNHRRNIRMNGHIEIICDDYLKQRTGWGVGGLLLHEFVHAYDFHCLSSDHSAKLKLVSVLSVIFVVVVVCVSFVNVANTLCNDAVTERRPSTNANNFTLIKTQMVSPMSANSLLNYRLLIWVARMN